MINALLHKQPVALDRNDHRFVRLRLPITDWSVAARLNAVFLTAVECGDAAREYPIVFVKAGAGADGKTEIAPLAVLGMQAESNLFVDATKWRARYMPAVVRMYPFAIGRMDRLGPDRFAICFDAACAALAGSEGEPMFTPEGEQSTLMNEIVGQLEKLEVEIQRTQNICRLLRDLDLLQEMRYDATLPDGSKLSLDGFLVIDEAKLNALADDKVLELHKNGILGLIHAHYISMGNIRKVLEWHAERHVTAPASA